MQDPRMLRASVARTLSGLRCRRRQALSLPRAAAYATLTDRFPLYPVEGPRTSVSKEPIVDVPKSRKELLQQIEQLKGETRELEAVAAQTAKAQDSEEHTAELPPWTEEDYQTFYTSLIASAAGDALASPLLLLASPPSTPLLPDMSRIEMQEVVAEAATRLRRSRLAAVEGEVDDQGGSGDARTSRVTDAVVGGRAAGLELLAEIESLQVLAKGGQERSALPTGSVTPLELKCLVGNVIQSQNLEAARRVLRSSEGTLTASEMTAAQTLLLQSYSVRGDVKGVAEYLKEVETSFPPTVQHLHYLVEAYVQAGNPHQAIRILHHFEDSQRILPMASYASTIGGLLTPLPTQSQSNKALAWDFLAHMRLVAHPTPSVELYTAVIRSCADPLDPQPERALDLVAEMQEETGVPLSGATYTAAILACSRVKKFYPEAFHLLSQMLEKHEAALVGGLADGELSGFEPSVDTFNALLEGTKRSGDLSRARWILTELMRLAEFGGARPNADTLVNLFHTYAAFKPKVSRADVKAPLSPREDTKDGSSDVQSRRADAEAAASLEQTDTARDLNPSSLVEDKLADMLDRRLMSVPANPPTGPQSSSECLREAENLFELIMAATEGSSTLSLFTDVAVSARLINAYLSVHMAHGPFDAGVEAWRAVWSDPRVAALRVRKNGWSYLAILEHLGAAKNHRKARDVVHGNLAAIWENYELWRASTPAMDPNGESAHLIGLGPRQIEKCTLGAVRAFSLIDDTDRALDILREFRQRFPAKDILDSYHEEPSFNNMVRLSIPSQIMEDKVPPHFLFHDIAPLHQKLGIRGDSSGIAFLKWACIGYEVALKKRRKMRLASRSSKPKLAQLAQPPPSSSPAKRIRAA